MRRHHSTIENYAHFESITGVHIKPTCWPLLINMPGILAIPIHSLALYRWPIDSGSSKYRLKGDYLDVPVRAGYRIVGDDKDGFLEDGIIVKTKGTGYIDPRYRNRRFEAQPIAQASHQKYFYAPQPVASSLMYPKYAVPEIIYGRRGKWLPYCMTAWAHILSKCACQQNGDLSSLWNWLKPK